jgi:hypothetical protein
LNSLLALPQEQFTTRIGELRDKYQLPEYK